MAINTKIGMPLDEFIEQGNSQRFELINGKRILKMPETFGHSELTRTLFLVLDAHAQSQSQGEVFSNTTFILPNGDDPNWVTGSRIPDLIFYAGNRIATNEAEHPDHWGKPLALVPDLVIEVVSPNDKVSEMDEKIDAYLLDGVRLIWVIDPQRRKAVVYAPDAEQPLHLAKDAVLDGGDGLPGFQIVLSKLFEPSEA